MNFDELLYDEIYAENSSSRLAHCEYSTKFLEIFVYLDRDIAPSFTAEVIPTGGLKDWLPGRKVPEFINGYKVAGGLRLLCQVWKPSDRMSADKYTIPFKDEDTLKEVLSKLQLPQCYPHDLVRRRYIPARAQPIFGSRENRTAIVCQSPDYSNLFMTMALSYDPLTRITNGFLGGEVDSTGRGPVTKLLVQLKKVAACAIQPMLLPVMAYNLWCDRLRIHVRDAAMDIHKKQKRTGLMDGYMMNSTQIAIARAKPGEYNSVHEDLVQTHASLTNDLSRFVEDLGMRCEHGLDLFHKTTESALEKQAELNSFMASKSLTEDQIKTSEAALRSYLDHWRLTAKVAFQQRDQQLARANMQLQVLYNLMQQRVAEEQRLVAQETKRDSNAMKSIALLTMVFLPSTALATIFSMSSFFTLDSQSFQLRVSSDFWIFWAIAIPLTALVILTWVLWIQRTEVSNLWNRQKESWQSARHERRQRRKARDEEKAKETVGRIPHHWETVEGTPIRATNRKHLNPQTPRDVTISSTNRTSSSQAVSPPPMDETHLPIIGRTYFPQQMRPELPIRITDALEYPSAPPMPRPQWD